MKKNILHIAYYSFAKGIPALLGLIFTPFLIKNLSVESYGKYNILNQLFLFLNSFTLITTFNLQREYLKDRLILGKIMILTLYISSFMFLLFVFFLYPLNLTGFSYRYLLFFYMIFIFMGIYQNQMISLNALNDSKAYMLNQVLFSVLKFAFGITLVVMTSNYLNVFVGIAIALILTSFNIQRKLDFSMKDIKIKIEKNLLKKVFNYGLPLSIYSSLDILLNYTDVFIIKFLKGIEYSGIYGGLYNTIDYIMLFPYSILAIIILPRMVQYENNHLRESSIKLVAISVMAYCLLVIPLLGLLFIERVREFSIKFLLTSEYLSYTDVGFILLIAMFFVGINKILMIFFQVVLKNVWSIITPLIVCLLLNVLLNLLLIPKYEIVGAAIATAAVNIILFIWLMILFLNMKKG